MVPNHARKAGGRSRSNDRSMNVKDMAILGGKARWAGKSAAEKREHGRRMAQAKKQKKLSTVPPVQGKGK